MKLVDLTTAKALQELGYDGEYAKSYADFGDPTVDPITSLLYPTEIPAPRLDDAAYWLRDRRGILIDIKPKGSGQYNVWLEFGFRKQMFDKFVVLKNSYDTYDDALEAAVTKVIEIIKNS